MDSSQRNKNLYDAVDLHKKKSGQPVHCERSKTMAALDQLCLLLLNSDSFWE